MNSTTETVINKNVFVEEKRDVLHDMLNKLCHANTLFYCFFVIAST